ncbi:MAG TPA: D-aminoacylase [Chthonomonadaceae bacterium]|nr:D-aminoacylase [Chthonomonadaceae bacterium]
MRRTLHGTIILAAILTLAAATLSRAQEAQTILIQGGTVLDGTGRPGHVKDIRVLRDRIIAIGRLKQQQGERVIDARGMVVSPGFIDTHSHADGGLLEDPDAETQVRQGITTSVVGQDGSSHFPLSDWFGELERKHVALNIASFLGHGTVRRQVMGDGYKRTSTPDEVKRMQELVRQEMRSGALGVSSGLEYDPGFYSSTEELIGLARASSPFGGIYISHVRDEGNDALKSFSELIRIAAEGHVPAQISHIKLDTQPVWGKAGDALRLMADARRRGLDISADVYPYLYWQSTIMVLIPSRDWDNRALWEKGLADVGGPEHVLLTTYSARPEWQGKTIAQIATQTGRDAIDVIQEIVHTAHDPGKTASEGVVVTAMTDADLDAFIADPHIMFCSDGGLHGSHPRGAGSFPRVLGVYVRERHVLTLPQAVHKMTGLPAQRMGFRDRGHIAHGMKADIVVFDPATVRDTATTANPQSPPVGIPYVFVNGQLVVDNGAVTGRHPGAVLRHESPPETMK